MSQPVVQVLEHFNLAADLSKEGEAKLLCPFHAEATPSCGIDLESGMWHCFGCGRGGSLIEFVAGMNGGDPLKAMILVRELRGKEVTDELPRPERRKRIDAISHMEQLPERWRSFHKVNWERLSIKHPVARYLIEKRGFRRHVLNAFDVRLTEEAFYPVVFPIFQKGNLIGWAKRRLDNDEPKYLYNEGFPGDWGMGYHKLDYSPCLVVEGVLDYMKAAQFGAKHVAGILGWQIKEAQAKFLQAQGVQVVICALDNTPTGQKGCQELRRHFRSVYRLQYPGTWRKDIADLTVNEFNKCMFDIVGH